MVQIRSQGVAKSVKLKQLERLILDTLEKWPDPVQQLCVGCLCKQYIARQWGEIRKQNIQDINSQLASHELIQREISFHPSYALVLQLFRNAKEFSVSFENEMQLSAMKREQSKLQSSYSQHVS